MTKLLACFATFACACACAPAFAADHLVDSSGVQSPLTNLTQAMAVALPGDRIFVLPGSYPAFHFSRGVEVIGLGTHPSQVTIARVDFHPTIPTNDFDAGLTNLTVCSSAVEDSTSISGNELAEGTLTLEGVATCGGVYLRGAGNLYVLATNCDFAPGPGDGFLGAAFDFGGGIADFVDSRIAGANASATELTLAGLGLRVGGGTVVRISGCEVSGGDGADSAIAVLRNGADAIEKGLGAALPKLRLSGNTLVAGGDGAVLGSGGAGVDLVAEIKTGDAAVAGGSGTPAGQAWPASQPVAMAFDPHLTMTPAKAFASGDTFLRPPSLAVIQPGAALPGFSMGWALAVNKPSTAVVTPLFGAQPIQGSQFGVHANGLDYRRGGAYVRRRIWVQGFYQEFENGPLISTNPVAVTVSLH